MKKTFAILALLSSAVLASLVAHGQNAKETQPAKESQAAIDNGTIQIVLTGDSIVNRKLSVYDDPASAGLFQIIRQSDAAFTNFETLVHNYAYPGASQSGGAYMSSPEWIPGELRWAGFNLLSTANNHAYDFGQEGLLSTLRALDAAGLAHAGTGANLALARAPAYLDTKRGRVALVAVASTFTEGSLAGEQRPDLPGRPGVDPLRFTTTYTVDQEEFQELQKVARLARGGGGGEGQDETRVPGEGRGRVQAQGQAYGSGGASGQTPDAPAQGADRGQGPGSRVRIGDLQFQVGDTPGVHTRLNQSDLDGLIASVKNAHSQAEWVVVSSHTHEGGQGQGTPPEFLVTAAHAAIDAGADVFVSHGPHTLKGIEIYKGKPIFYSLGNFIFENETMLFQPAESFDSLGLPSSATVADFYDARSGNDTRGFPVQRGVWESAIAEVTFNNDHTLNKITLTPISLGYMEPRSERGRPRLATPEQAKVTIDNLTKLSEPYGTKVVFNAGRGIVLGEVGQK
jgi:poly-gamma-glutamate synthesis protein (capsule biosynthesis protein)